MKKPSKARLIRWGIGAVCAIAMAWMVIAGRVSGWTELTELPPRSLFHLLCDACFLPGVLCLLFGAMIAMANAGALDAIGYLFHVLICQFNPARDGRITSYFDYVQERRAKPGTPVGFLLVIGAVMVALACVFLALYDFV